jgi:hypothetical protein
MQWLVVGQLIADSPSVMFVKSVSDQLAPAFVVLRIPVPATAKQVLAPGQLIAEM